MISHLILTGNLRGESYCPHYMDKETEPQRGCFPLFKLLHLPGLLSHYLCLLYFKAYIFSVIFSGKFVLTLLPPSQSDVFLLRTHRTLYVTALRITIVFLVQYVGVLLCVGSTLTITNPVVLSAELGGKGVYIESAFWSRWTILGKQEKEA